MRLPANFRASGALGGKASAARLPPAGGQSRRHCRKLLGSDPGPVGAYEG